MFCSKPKLTQEDWMAYGKLAIGKTQRCLSPLNHPGAGGTEHFEMAERVDRMAETQYKGALTQTDADPLAKVKHACGNCAEQQLLCYFILRDILPTAVAENVKFFRYNLVNGGKDHTILKVSYTQQGRKLSMILDPWANVITSSLEAYFAKSGETIAKMNRMAAEHYDEVMRRCQDGSYTLLTTDGREWSLAKALLLDIYRDLYGEGSSKLSSRVLFDRILGQRERYLAAMNAAQFIPQNTTQYQRWKDHENSGEIKIDRLDPRVQKAFSALVPKTWLSTLTSPSICGTMGAAVSLLFGASAVTPIVLTGVAAAAGSAFIKDYWKYPPAAPELN